MKKTLLAAALLAGFAGAASAQSSVTLYGLIDMGIGYQTVNGGTDAQNQSHFGLYNGVQNGSRWGLRGVEDMGNGNRATFVLESGFDSANGTSGQSGRLFGRQSWFGLENNSWGYVRLGRQYNFASDYVTPIDPFLAGFGTANMGNSFGAMNTTRYSNMIKYQTPTWNGFKAGIGYSFAPQLEAFYVTTNNRTGAQTVVNGTGNAYNFDTMSNTRALTLGANYANGPLTISASYDQVMPNANVVAPTGTTAANSTPKQWILAGMYDFTAVKLSLAYSQTRGGLINGQSASGYAGGGSGGVNGGTYGGAAGGVLFGDGIGYNSYLVGLTAPINASSKVFGSWQMAAPNGNIQDLYTTANQNTYAIGYQYDFTKRTNVYASVAYVNGVGFLSGVSTTQIFTGLRHQF